MFHLMSVPRSVQGTMEEVKNMKKYDYELTGLYSWTGSGQRNWSEIYLRSPLGVFHYGAPSVAGHQSFLTSW